MPTPEVSIILSTYNDEDSIANSIDSILRQSYTNWQLIIINDASTDNTESVVKKYVSNQKNIIYYKNRKNKGLTHNLNQGIKSTNSKYIARIDGDDTWESDDKLSKQVDFLNSHKDYALVGSWANALDQEGVALFTLKYPTKDMKIRKNMLRHNCFVHSSVLIRRKALKKIGYYDENPNRKCVEDYDTWLRLGRFFKLKNIPQVMVNHKINLKGLSNQNFSKQINNTLKLLNENRYYYPGFYISYFLWSLRKYYTPKTKIHLSKIKNKLH